MNKIYGILIIVSLICIGTAVADAPAHLTVTWTNVFADFYTGEACIEDVSVFGSFEEILIEWGAMMPSQDTLVDQGGNRYCSDLNGELFQAPEQLANAKITVKEATCDNEICYQDQVWSQDVGVDLDEPAHGFSGEGAVGDQGGNEEEIPEFSSTGKIIVTVIALIVVAIIAQMLMKKKEKQ